MSTGRYNTLAIALDHFERVSKPVLIGTIKTQTIDDYIARRRLERGLKPKSKVSPATVNRELRHLKVVLRIANDWNYLGKVPKIRMVREPKKLVRFVTPEHFAAIYQACEVAKTPKDAPCPADWWRALVTFCYMTGWRVGEPLALRRDDLDLEAGKAIMRHQDNKGHREESVPLHPVVIQHLEKIRSFSQLVFAWPHPRRVLWDEFGRIQRAAGIKLPCREDHEHNDSCHTYGFHDLRRAFATQNAPRLTADALQALMRHKSYTTTQRYINMASQLEDAVDSLAVPDVLKVSVG